MTYRNQLLVDGEWLDGGGTPFAVLDPSTERPIAEVQTATDDDLRRALEAAARGGKTWAAVAPWDRSLLLREIAARMRDRAGDLGAIVTAEQGKTLAEGIGEVRVGADYFDWYADEARRIYGRVVPGRTADRRMTITHEPVGPVAAFTPNNFPWALPARKVAAALAAGCSMVLKPAEDTPLSALAMAELCQDAGLPAGVLNVVTGDPAHISSVLVGSPVIRKISLTGSVAVGKLLLALGAQGVKRASMELGGHSPVLVLADADPVAAARAAVASKFRNCGQVCVSPSRFLVSAAVYDEFVAEMVRQTEKLVVGPGTEAGSETGPLVSARRRAAVEELVEDARGKGAKVLTGGERTPGRPSGYYYQPTVLTDLTPDMRVLTEEPFGPLAPVVRFDDLDEAIEIANGVEVGLAGYVFGTDVLEAERVAARLDVGMVSVNSYLLALPEAPFGGIKHSGYGHEGGSEGILDYLSVRYVNAPC
ncbi:NAD-dependent succinate-semialdehyde dehydrogenase [Amycolatopsis rhabdoformis]|uniref:NAD-dependent succinate-semialdehyde dehydrogenase n=1 Tax=Amycolatopsis rhabdoformis TaxID=1448059 RepID=A0ABZ1ICX6_9PSEU|nr:NAD-dependent succinate-semialdehyde dehydrogenase [Amycolatopsis rhabdoformis]WSE31899.1 NAD-dependent succinate-semialdehyde dehydrogenase [Amycolatopsis rhabdoformis]